MRKRHEGQTEYERGLRDRVVWYVYVYQSSQEKGGWWNVWRLGDSGSRAAEEAGGGFWAQQVTEGCICLALEEEGGGECKESGPTGRASLPATLRQVSA